MSDPIPELADDDLDVLMEALEAWEVKDQFGDAMTNIVGSMIARRDPIARARMEHERAVDKRNAEHAKRMRKERSVLLRAKLLQIRDRRRAEHLTDEALNR